MFLGFILFYERKGSMPLIADQWVGTEPGGRGLSSAGSAIAAAPPAENCRERRAHSTRVSGGGAEPMRVWKKPLWAGRTPTRSNGWLRGPGGGPCSGDPAAFQKTGERPNIFAAKEGLGWHGNGPTGAQCHAPRGVGVGVCITV